MKHKQLTQWLPTALLGLTLAGAAAFTPAAQAQLVIVGTNNIVTEDFSAVPSWVWNWTYWYHNAGGGTDGPLLLDWKTPYDDSAAPGGSLCMRFQFDNSGNAGVSDYGCGVGGPCLSGWNWDPTVFISTNLSDYILDFDARVEGLVPGQTDASGEMQFRFCLAQGDAIHCNFNVTMHTNYTHFSMLLSDADRFSDGTVSNFVYCIQNYLINNVQFGFDLHNPGDWWGTDNDNALFLDNIQLRVIVWGGTPLPIPPTVPYTVFEWNMDDKPLWSTWGGGPGWSANSYIPMFTIPSGDADMDGTGVNGSRGFWLQMDNSMLAPPNTPAWAGGQNGSTGPVDLSKFTDGLPERYVFEVDARAEGLADGVTDTTVDCQLFLNDSGVQLNFSVPAGSNWIHSATTFSDVANWSGGTATGKAIFATNYPAITGCNVQWQMNNAANGSVWGYDTDNRIIVDNLKLTHYVVACPPLTLTTYGTDRVLSWGPLNTPDGYAQLQSAGSLAGPWSDVLVGGLPATSPYTNTIAGAPNYFRTQWVPPR